MHILERFSELQLKYVSFVKTNSALRTYDIMSLLPAQGPGVYNHNDLEHLDLQLCPSNTTLLEVWPPLQQDEG